MICGGVLLGENTDGGCFTSRKFFCDVVNMGSTIILGPLSVFSATTGSGRDTVGCAIRSQRPLLCACAEFAKVVRSVQPAASVMLRLGVLFVVFLPLFRCQSLPFIGQCLPRVIVSTSVRATARLSEQLVCSDSYREFRDLLKEEVSTNIKLGKGCSLLAVSEPSCGPSGQCFFFLK